LSGGFRKDGRGSRRDGGDGRVLEGLEGWEGYWKMVNGVGRNRMIGGVLEKMIGMRGS
jgi:hypothetical protein